MIAEPLRGLKEPILRPPLTSTRPAPRSARARARGAVLSGAAAFVFATLGLSAALETVLPQLRDPEYGYRVVRTREQQKRHPGRPLVVVLGTSRTANGFDPKVANDRPGGPLLANFGLSGAGPAHLRSRLAALRADGVAPTAVLVELSLASLVVEDVPAAKLTAADLPRLGPDAPRAAWLRARANPWQAHRIVIMNHADPLLLPKSERLDHYWKHTDRYGFDAYPTNGTDEQRPRRLAARRATYEPLARAAQVGPRADAAVRGLVADCRAAGVPLAFFATPESPEFRSWYTPESRTRLDEYMRAVTAELGVPVFAAPDDYAEADFADGHHMLPPAAARFSRELAERHLGPWLASLSKRGTP